MIRVRAAAEKNIRSVMENKKVINTKSAGGIVINKNGKILVVSQHGTSWSLPKGHLDEGESEKGNLRGIRH